MKVAVTGSNGKLGRALISELDPTKFEIAKLDLPDHDVSDLDKLVEATRGQDAIFHFAWAALRDNYLSGNVDPINTKMVFNAYQAAVINKIPRVIMASSNHAHRHDLRDTDGKIRASINPPIPDSPYGAEKVFMESLGRYYAHDKGLEVVCLRIGNVNDEDRPSGDEPSRWMSHADFGNLVTACLTASEVPDNFQIVYGVSRQEVFDWANTFGYEPMDAS